MFVGEVTTGKKVGVASEMEYLIKWKGKSYVHNTWHTGKASLRDVLMEIMVWLVYICTCSCNSLRHYITIQSYKLTRGMYTHTHTYTHMYMYMHVHVSLT